MVVVGISTTEDWLGMMNHSPLIFVLNTIYPSIDTTKQKGEKELEQSSVESFTPPLPRG